MFGQLNWFWDDWQIKHFSSDFCRIFLIECFLITSRILVNTEVKLRMSSGSMVSQTVDIDSQIMLYFMIKYKYS